MGHREHFRRRLGHSVKVLEGQIYAAQSPPRGCFVLRVGTHGEAFHSKLGSNHQRWNHGHTAPRLGSVRASRSRFELWASGSTFLEGLIMRPHPLTESESLPTHNTWSSPVEVTCGLLGAGGSCPPVIVVAEKLLVMVCSFHFVLFLVCDPCSSDHTLKVPFIIAASEEYIQSTFRTI
ncbi:hypothetical protein MPTK1_6g14960 [Marchantia polymorpha subsp. ruderalis]|uniref:Uncharacterized protein n=2 Tax=Marchantia polymorpha TaxID=3197 RepID=A0AAF6BS61_MARPO|nr:hypothetical protein MARPO_0056s0007 [Marchantia polymorpha]BBN14845.1 hypothetical protein Mp_6g14960 [Marchantia polymorpha subsp. ruderalis]|eukprot:PTQ37527.1 hypothetical protein MARPO_0056s0007 [Marchantia polymorpha]